MRQRTRLKTQLRKAGKVCLGSWITLGHEAIAEIMCGAGFDWLCVDLEHSTISIEQAGQLIRVIDLGGCVPLVRLSSNDPVQIKRVMDAGAHGIIVPMLNSKADAQRAYQAMHYPPLGTRGVGLARAQSYGVGFADYKTNLDSAVLIAQIEHIDAVRNLEEILMSPEVDGYIIGPYDLSASLGYPGEFKRPELIEALRRIDEVGKKSGKPGGIHVVEPSPELLEKAIDDGMRFIAYSVDIRMIEQSCSRGLAHVNELWTKTKETR